MLSRDRPHASAATTALPAPRLSRRNYQDSRKEWNGDHWRFLNPAGLPARRTADWQINRACPVGVALSEVLPPAASGIVLAPIALCSSCAAMSPGRVIPAVLLACSWCWAAWHADLEGAGLMFDHEHVRAHHHDAGSSHDHPAPSYGDEHSPVWARDQLKDGTLRLLVQAMFAFLLGAAILRFAISGQAAFRTDRRRRRRPDYLPVWQFVRRCAPDSAAPPALS